MSKTLAPIIIKTTDPTVNDDAGDGYVVGQTWLNSVSGGLFVLRVSTVGSATWVNAGGGGIIISSGQIAIGGASNSITGYDSLTWNNASKYLNFDLAGFFAGGIRINVDHDSNTEVFKIVNSNLGTFAYASAALYCSSGWLYLKVGQGRSTIQSTATYGLDIIANGEIVVQSPSLEARGLLKVCGSSTSNDSVILSSRGSGGAGRSVTITTAILTGIRIATLPDADITIAGINIAQTFTANQTISFSTAGIANRLALRNTDAGVSSVCQFIIGNDSSTAIGYFFATSSTYTGGYAGASAMHFGSNGHLGILAGNIMRMSILSSGEIMIGSPTLPTSGAGILQIAGGNFINMGQAGVGAPTFTTVSAGTKIILYNAISGVATNFALGIDTSTLWYSVPNSSSYFRWYAGTTQIAQLDGNGSLTVSNTLAANALTLTGTNAYADIYIATSGTPRLNLRTNARYDALINNTSALELVYNTSGTPKTLSWNGDLNVPGTISVDTTITSNQGVLQILGVTSNVGAAIGSNLPQQTIYGGNTNNRFEFGMDNSGSVACAYIQSRNSATGAQYLALNPKGGTIYMFGSSTASNGFTAGTGTLVLNNGTSNILYYGAAGVAPPATTTRSAGTKIVLADGVSANTLDYAIGIESGTMWFSTYGVGNTFKFYVGPNEPSLSIYQDTIYIGKGAQNLGTNKGNISIYGNDTYPTIYFKAYGNTKATIFADAVNGDLYVEYTSGRAIYIRDGIGGSLAVTFDSNGVLVTNRVREAGTFADIHVHDASTAQSITNGATYTKLTCFTDNGESANCTPDQANDKITITKTGRYLATFNVSYSSGTNNLTWKFSAFLGGTEQNQIHASSKLTTGADMQACSAAGIIDVTSANTDLDLRAAHDGGSAANLTVIYSTLMVTYLGET